VEQDEEFVREYCKKKGLTYATKEVDVEQAANEYKTSSENAARIERRLFFEELRNKHNASYILTAHHLDDQIETILYRMIRGTKLTGLTGINEQE